MADNVLDKLIGYFMPELALARSRARLQKRIYEGADRGRRGAAWNATGTSANTELSGAISPLRDRSRELARNNPWATRMLDILSTHTVGNGIVPVSNTGSDKIDNRVNAIWEAWCEQADIQNHGLSFYAMQDLAVRSMIESGDVVMRFIDKELNDNDAVPLSVQLLEADFIDHFREGIFAYERGAAPAGIKRNRLGVALGDYDEWRGLWLWPRHPGEQTNVQEINYNSQFVARDDLVHMFKRERPGQVRGIPWFAPILQTARDLDDIRDAANVKARVEACFAGFITNTDDSMAIMEDNGATPSIPGAVVSTLEPGMLKELRTGQDIKFAAPTSTSQLETILLLNLQAMAAGVGCTYDQATGDLRQANYSSLRAGKIEFWRLIGKLQQHVIIPQMCKPVWQRVMNRAVLAGRLPARTNKGGYPARWVVPAKEMIDPKKDFDALKNMVRAGAMTPQEFIASFGGDWRKSIDQFREFFAMCAEGKQPVIFDTDVAHVDQHGRQPTSKGSDAEQPEEGDPALDDVELKKDDDDDDKSDD